MNTNIETMPKNTLKSLRNILFKELSDLRNGESEPQQSIAVSKLCSQVIASYKTEIDAVKVANDLKDKNMEYAHSLAAIQTQDTKEPLKS